MSAAGDAALAIGLAVLYAGIGVVVVRALMAGRDALTSNIIRLMGFNNPG